MPYSRRALCTLFVALLAACGDGANSSNTVAPDAPAATGMPALPASYAEVALASSVASPTYSAGSQQSDGFALMNERRVRGGAGALAQSVALDRAAQAHSNYLALNSGLSHDEASGRPGYTGATAPARAAAAGFTGPAVAEVFGDSTALFTSIFQLIEAMGPATSVGRSSDDGIIVMGRTSAYGQVPASGVIKAYPYPDQVDVPTSFNLESETPRANLPQTGLVGAPIYFSGANYDSLRSASGITRLQSAALKDQAGNLVPAYVLGQSSLAEATVGVIDDLFPRLDFVMVPKATTVPGARYTVEVKMVINGVSAERSWSFTTRAAQ